MQCIDIIKNISSSGTYIPALMNCREKVYPDMNIDPVTYCNTLYYDDNYTVMQDILAQGGAGCIDCIYIDPPYASHARYNYTIQFNDSISAPSITVPAFSDTWNNDIVQYLEMLYPRLVSMRDLLSEQGSIYVHLDYHSVHYVKVMMDQIFGDKNFINEIIWSYTGTGSPQKGFKRKHDVILLYVKSNDFYFNHDAASEAQTEKSKSKYTMCDEEGKRYKQYRHRDGSIRRHYLNEHTRIRMRDVWDISTIQSWNEKLHYETQKPEALLEKIISVSCPQNGVVADFFCGSGTTLAVAERLGRKWIGADSEHYAVMLSRNRLIHMQAHPFQIQSTKTDTFLTLTSQYFTVSKNEKQETEICLNNFTLNTDVPHIQKIVKIKSILEHIQWENTIDYWAIDWNYNGSIFHARWQSCRINRKKPVSVTLKANSNNFPVQYPIAIRVIDIFGTVYQTIVRQA